MMDCRKRREIRHASSHLHAESLMMEGCRAIEREWGNGRALRSPALCSISCAAAAAPNKFEATTLAELDRAIN